MLKKSFAVVSSKKIKKFSKTIEVDSDKSISIRSFLIASISHNISEIKNVLESDDVFSTINCLKKLGVKIKKIKPKHYHVYGKGLGSLHIKKNSKLNFNNSGTLARLLIGILSTTPDIEIKVFGDQSLNKRDMSKLIGLMSIFGAEFFPKNRYKFPLKFISSEMPVGINYEAGVSAQLKSAVILAGLNSFGTTKITENKLSRNHTENILLNSSNSLTIKKINKEKNIIKVLGKNINLKPLNIYVPSDPSSAAFMTALTILNKDSSLRIKNVGLNPRRTGFYKLLKKHGARIKFKNLKKINNEFVGDILVKSSKLKPIKGGSNYYASTADEYPLLFILAGLTPGISKFDGIADLANKESNRIEEVKKILKSIGIKSKSTKNSIMIFGTNKIKNKTINIPNLGDHRICMSALVLSLITGIKTNIKNFETVKTSSPSFLNIIKSLGGNFEIKKKI